MPRLRIVAVCLLVLWVSAPVRADGPDAGPLSVEELVARARPSVVVVSHGGRDGRQSGLGTGFIISDDGLVATNLHVIGGEGRPISVTLADGRRHAVTEVHATDRQRDLAVLRIDANDLPALELADSDALRQGERVVAVGNPHGLRHSVVSGEVSGRREIEGMPLIQLAIPIEPGNSGGPLLDMHGRVHGILTLKSLVTRNLGFAVEINALKPLLEKPNPIPMSRWLTIGALDPKEWTPLSGATWRQRAGRIRVEGQGGGFGGRSLALATAEPPKPPFEVAVDVKLDAEDGAAGLVFHADGGDRHYGFYPSGGRLRLSRFDGADVFTWQVLREVRSPHYRAGEWNTLKVRVEPGRIVCFVNDEPVVESDDSVYAAGRVGLAKFRDTKAEFRRFRTGTELPAARPAPEVLERIAALAADLSPVRPPQSELVDELSADADVGAAVLRERARSLEQQAERLRQLARAVHENRVRRQLTELFEQDDAEIDLLHAALLIARLDNDELDVEAYLRTVERMAEDVSQTLGTDADEHQRLAALDRHLFEELGFHGSRSDYYNRSNSYLNEVIDDREGLPITLSVLYMELARRLGVNVVGVGLPGHFIVRHEPAEGEGRLIDPFDRAREMTREEAVARATAGGRPFHDEYLATQSKRAIVVRMLRNLIGTARDGNDPERLLRYVETVLVLEPESVEDRMVRAVLCYQTGRTQEALDDVDWLLEREPEELDLMRVRQLKRVLEEAQDEAPARHESAASSPSTP